MFTNAGKLVSAAFFAGVLLAPPVRARARAGAQPSPARVISA